MLKERDMEISEIKRITELIQKVNCQRIALVSEVAKEMGVKKTALMQFIEDNPKLFKIIEHQSRSAKGWVKTVGLAIQKVYLIPDDNPDTEEWLEKKKAEWDKKIHVGERNYYGCHEYWLIPEDFIPENNTLFKEGAYRNTPEKIKELADAGVIKKVTACHGGIGDCCNEEVYMFNDEVKKAIEDYGWTTDFDK